MAIDLLLRKRHVDGALDPDLQGADVSRTVEETDKRVVVVLRRRDVRRHAVARRIPCRPPTPQLAFASRDFLSVGTRVWGVTDAGVAVGEADPRRRFEVEHRRLARPSLRVVVHLRRLRLVLGEGVAVEDELAELLEAALHRRAAGAAVHPCARQGSRR